MEKTPDKIRRETVPFKHTGIIYGFLGGLLGAALWFGGWGLLHQQQVLRYPDYCTYAIQANTSGWSLLGAPSKPQRKGMSTSRLRYDLLRFGNEDHRYDREIIRRGWYPKGEDPTAWVLSKGAVKPVYSDGPLLVFKWPLALTLLTFLGCAIWGLVTDAKYRAAVISGIPLDRTIIATPKEYNHEVRGDGMKYAVKPWSDR